MRKLWQKIGTLAFWLSYPLLFVYLRIGWRTRLIVVAEDEILLVKGWLGSGQWQLPGGGLHYQEEPAKGACRELKEETGIISEPTALKLLFKQRAKQTGLRYKYYCYQLTINPKPELRKQALEITDMTWMPIKSISKTNVTQETYQAVQAWLRQANLL